MNALAERGRQWPTGDASARVARGADESADRPAALVDRPRISW